MFPLPATAVVLCVKDAKLYIPRIAGRFDEDFHLWYYMKVISLWFLKIITLPLLKMTYTSKSSNWIALWIYNLASKLFVYMEGLLKAKLPAHEGLYIEIVEYLYVFLEDARELLMPALEPLIEWFFESDLFFDCPSKALSLWSKIISWNVEANSDKIFSKFVSGVNSSSLFSSSGELAKIKFKSFHRLCFILYV